jgi:hypothetical protein
MSKDEPDSDEFLRVLDAIANDCSGFLRLAITSFDFFMIIVDLEENDNMNDIPTGANKPQKKVLHKEENKMNRTEWILAIEKAMEFLQKQKGPLGLLFNITEFSLEGKARYGRSAKGKLRRYFRMFPWFHMTDARLRETLKTDSAEGITIWRVIEAMNKLMLIDFSQSDSRERLKKCYEKMEPPICSKCLTAIVHVETEMFPASATEQIERITPLTTAMTTTPTPTMIISPSTVTVPTSLFFQEHFDSETLIPLSDQLFVRGRDCLEASLENNRKRIREMETVLADSAATHLNSADKRLCLDLIRSSQHDIDRLWAHLDSQRDLT